MKKLFFGIVILGAAAAAGYWFYINMPGGQLDQARERRTVIDLQTASNVVLSWMSVSLDEGVTGISSDQPPTVFTLPAITNSTQQVPLRKLSYEDLMLRVEPKFGRQFSKTDGWGRDFEFYLADEFSGNTVFLIRSAGRDKVFSGESYIKGTVETGTPNDDLVILDGSFLRGPTPK